MSSSSSHSLPTIERTRLPPSLPSSPSLSLSAASASAASTGGGLAASPQAASGGNSHSATISPNCATQQRRISPIPGDTASNINLTKSSQIGGTTTTTTTTTTSTTTTTNSASSASISAVSGGSAVSSGSGSRRRHQHLHRQSPSDQQQHQQQPRVVFGPGTVSRLPAELGRLGLSRPLIVSTPSRVPLARRIQSLIPNLDSRILDSAVVNVPARVVDDAMARISGRDCVISVGGGSALALARVVGVRKDIPHVCIPTTYSGSEVGDVNAISWTAAHGGPAGYGAAALASGAANGKRFAARDHKVLPTVVIYDEDLTASLPKRISAPSGASATAHAAKSSRVRRSSKDDNAQWSYIHLPGV